MQGARLVLSVSVGRRAGCGDIPDVVADGVDGDVDVVEVVRFDMLDVVEVVRVDIVGVVVDVV